MQFLGSHNVADLVACHVEEHELPRHKGTFARVRQIPVADVERLFRIAGKQGADGDKARFELICRSIVNEDGTPVFTDETVQSLKTGNQPIFLDLIDVVARANNKKPAEVQQEADDLEKN